MNTSLVPKMPPEVQQRLGMMGDYLFDMAEQIEFLERTIEGKEQLDAVRDLRASMEVIHRTVNDLDGVWFKHLAEVRVLVEMLGAQRDAAIREHEALKDAIEFDQVEEFVAEMWDGYLHELTQQELKDWFEAELTVSERQDIAHVIQSVQSLVDDGGYYIPLLKKLIGLVEAVQDE